MTRYVLADDLTGASDAGVQFAKLGFRTQLWLDYTGTTGDSELGDPDADLLVVIDTDSRAESPASAYARLTALLHRIGSQNILKKIDSTLRGNIGAELRALLDALPDAFAIVCPSYPKNGRTVRDGLLFVNGTPVHETDFGRDLFSPVRDARIAAHLDEPFVACSLAMLRSGIETLECAIDDAHDRKIRVAIVDAETDDDLRVLASLARRRRDLLWVGSAGIIEMLALTMTAAAHNDSFTVCGPVLFLVGSLSAMTQLQIAEFASDALAELVDPVDLLRDATSVAATVRLIGLALERGDNALLALDGAQSKVEAALALGRQRGWNARATGVRIREALFVTVAPLVQGRPGATFMLSGGDIARSFCEAYGVQGLELLCETASGVPLSRAIGADMYLITKAGGFGRPQTYRDILTAFQPKAVLA